MSHHHIAHSDGVSVSKRAEAAALGAIVADAATMPAQWCYDQAKLAAIEGDIAFYPSHIAPWYAARKVCHQLLPPRRLMHNMSQLQPLHLCRSCNRLAPLQIGDTSLGGECVLITLRANKAAGGWDRFALGDASMASVGPGGTYVGYADHQAKGLVLALLQQDAALGRAAAPPAGFADAAVTAFVQRKLRALVRTQLQAHAAPAAVSAAALAAAREAAPAIDAAGVAYVESAASAMVDLLSTPTGGDDTQSPSLARIAPLVGAYAGHRELQHVVTEAVRVTASNDDSVMYGAFAARLLEAVLLGASIADAVAANIGHLHMPHRAAVEAAAHAGREDAIGGAGGAGANPFARIAHFGLPCGLASVVPGVVYLAVRHGSGSSFAAAVRENARAGGDSCGRAVLLGALLAAVYAPVGTGSPSAAAGAGAADAAAGGAAAFAFGGVCEGDGPGVPAAWVARLNCKDELATLLPKLHRPVVGVEAGEHVHVHSPVHGGGASAKP